MNAIKARGHQVQVVNPLRCYMNLASGKPLVFYRGQELHFDAIIPRIGASVTFYGTAVLRQFEMMGSYSLNDSIAITRSRDKLRSLQVLSRKGVGMPATGFAHSTQAVDNLIQLVGGAPLIIKLLEGTQGKGVVLAETKKAAQSVIEAFRKLDAHFLVQEFIKESAGRDVRCFVIGDKVVAAMERKGADGDFRSNLHRGGTARAIKISPAERKTAVDAVKAMGLRVAGVDILRSNRGPLVMEVNSSPGLEGIEKTTGKDVSTMIVQFIEKKAKLGGNQSRG